MPSALHEYSVLVEWSGGRDGRGVVTPQASGTRLQIAVPPEFQGPGGATNPEELLTSAIAGCYSITFGIVAANRKLPVLDLSVTAIGVVEQSGANFTYKQITIQPMITVATTATDEQISATTEMAHKADIYCIVTNAVRGKVEVVVEPTVVRA